MFSIVSNDNNLDSDLNENLNENIVKLSKKVQNLVKEAENFIQKQAVRNNVNEDASKISSGRKRCRPSCLKY